MKPQADVREYGSPADNQAAASLLAELRNKIFEFDEFVQEILVQSLSGITEVCVCLSLLVYCCMVHLAVGLSLDQIF